MFLREHALLAALPALNACHNSVVICLPVEVGRHPVSGCKQLQPVGGLESIHEFKDSFDPFSDVCVRSQSGLRLPQRTRQYNDRLGMSDPRRAITEPAQMSEPAANRKLLPLTGLAVAEYGDELEIFFPTRIGLPAAVVGLLFLLVAGNRTHQPSNRRGRRSSDDREHVPRRFPGEGSAEGRTVGRAGLAAPAGTTLLAIRRDDQAIPGPAPEVVLEPGDVLEYDATVSAVGNLWTTMA